MGLLRWFGTAEGRFARQVLEAVRATGHVAEARYERDAFAIAYRLLGRAGEGHIYLANAFREISHLARRDRAAKLTQFVAMLADEPVGEQRWEDVKGDLLPVVRGVTFGLGTPAGHLPPLSRPFLPYLAEFVVIDRPASMAYITAALVDPWGVDADEIFATARANLARRAPTLTSGTADGGPAVLRFIDDGDAYFTSMLLVDGLLGSLTERVGARPVAFVPDSRTLVIAPDSPDTLPPVFDQIEEEYRQAVRSTSPAGYTVDDFGAVVPYAAVEPLELANRVHRSEVLLAATEYGAQKESLDQLRERDGTDLHVASLMAVGRPDGSVYSLAVWGDGVDSLLPLADCVSFTTEGMEPLFVPWHVVVAEAGLAATPGYVPARYRVTAWPPEQVMSRLRAEAVTP